MPGDMPLLALQQHMLRALQEPLSGESRTRTALAPRPEGASHVVSQVADLLLTPSASLRPAERLELYHRQYWFRLLDALEEDFPALQRWLGTAAFWDLAEGYLLAHPSRSFTLRHLGYALPAYLPKHAFRNPVTALDTAFALDLARLEVALCQAFEAGERPPLAGAALGESTIALQPYVKLLSLDYPVDTLWRQRRLSSARRERFARAQPRTRWLIVYRRGSRVEVERVPKAAFAILVALQNTGHLERALEDVATVPGLLRCQDQSRIADWFSQWVARGWFCAG